MMTKEDAFSTEASCFRLHLTNVTGTGATQLLKSLLPALERHPGTRLAEIYLPDTGELSSYKSAKGHGPSVQYRRRLPNPLSRLLECLILARQFDGDSPLLVLGDLPLRCNSPQVVFVQTPHLCQPGGSLMRRLRDAKYAISRWVFAKNLRFASAVIVQTPVMRDLLSATYPDVGARIRIIAQPVPQWLLSVTPDRKYSRRKNVNKLRLIYPAASYPHKNHRLLADINTDNCGGWPIQEVTLTIPEKLNPAPRIPWIRCVGLLSSAEMVRAYQEADGLLFLSTDESYGFPLLEAMYLGMPVICPDLPYAHALCGDGAIYFNPTNIASLRSAIDELHTRLADDWSPDWSAQLADTPQDWDTVASSMLALLMSSAATHAR